MFFDNWEAASVVLTINLQKSSSTLASKARELIATSTSSAATHSPAPAAPRTQVPIAKKVKRDALTDMSEMAKADQAQYERELHLRHEEQMALIALKSAKSTQRHERRLAKEKTKQMKYAAQQARVL
jgi:hypothetical protein